MSESHVEVRRGAFVESRHYVNVAVADPQGRLRASSGDAQFMTFARSAIKPMQALPLVEDGVTDRYDFSGPELAICCGSHNGEPRHVEIVRGMLRKIAADEDALACGAHLPMSSAATQQLSASGAQPGRIHNNCSGKHAGMLALARFHGWPLAGYHAFEHPVQQRMVREVSRWAMIHPEEFAFAADGCGVVTFGLPLANLAVAFASYSAAARRAESGPATVVQAMVRHPDCVAGSDRLCTDLMRVAGGRIFVKVGAEGVYCAGVPGAEIGIAIKIDDGATRAAEPALIAVLRALGLLSEDEVGALEKYAEPDVMNTRGERVGTIRADVRLQASS